MFLRTALLVLRKDAAIEAKSWEVLTTTVFFAKVRTIARWQSALSSASFRTSSGEASFDPGVGMALRLRPFWKQQQATRKRIVDFVTSSQESRAARR